MQQKPDGQLVVIETNTPYMVFKAGSNRFSAMVKALEDNGFTVSQALGRRDEAFDAAVSAYTRPDEWWSYASYMVIAQKRDATETKPV